MSTPAAPAVRGRLLAVALVGAACTVAAGAGLCLATVPGGGRGVSVQRTGGNPATLRQSFRHRNRDAARLAGFGSVLPTLPLSPRLGGV